MGFSFIPCALITAFWAVIGIVLPIFLPKGTNRGLIQLSLILTAATSWLFWLCAYMAQMNPLIGPKLKNTTILMMANEWLASLVLRDLAILLARSARSFIFTAVFFKAKRVTK